MKMGILYYTNNILPVKFMTVVQDRLVKSALEIPIVYVCQQPPPFEVEDENLLIVGPLPRLVTSILAQMILGLQQLKQKGIDYVFCAEHDVLYSHGYFNYTPPNDRLTITYNLNSFRMIKDGFFPRTSRGLSQCSGYVEAMLMACETRQYLFNSGQENKALFIEPGRDKYEKKMGLKTIERQSLHPTIDIRYGNTFTAQFRGNPDLCSSILYWGSYHDMWNSLGVYDYD